MFFPSSVHVPSPRSHHADLPRGLQIAVHNALSVAVNGREYAVDDGNTASEPLDQPARRQRGSLPEPPELTDSDDVDDGYKYVGGKSGQAEGAAEEEQRRLVSSTVDSAVATQPPSVSAAASIPLTLVDQRNRVVARGVFQQSGESAVPATVSQLPAALSADGGGSGRDALNQLADELSARLAQRIGGRMAQDANAAPSGGVEIALTDSAGRVVGVGTYFPHNPSQLEQSSASGLSSPQQQLPTPQQSQQQQVTDTLQLPAAVNPAGQNRAAQQPGARTSRTSSQTVQWCYGNPYDSIHCRPVPHNGKSYLHRHSRLVDTQLLPATSPIYTTDEEAAIERSRSPYYPASPRMVVIEPQHTTLYAAADITQSLATSLAVFPPVAPFMARPRSAAAEVEKQAVEAAQAAAPAEAAEGDRGVGVLAEEAAEARGTLAGEAAAAAATQPALPELGTGFRNQA